jgi:hypothetical protein
MDISIIQFTTAHTYVVSVSCVVTSPPVTVSNGVFSIYSDFSICPCASATAGLG